MSTDTTALPRQIRRNLGASGSRFYGLDGSTIGLAVAWVFGAAAYLVWRGQFFSPDQFFVLAMLAAICLGRFRAFLWDWLPLLLLLYGYEYVRSLVGFLNERAHINLMIDFDRFVFGRLPTLSLQSRFYAPGASHWYDYAAVGLYMMHFVIPLTAAFLFWLKDRELFKRYAASMVMLSYLAYLTYLAYPAVPPWMAAQAGVLPAVVKIMDITLLQLSHPIYLPSVYRLLGVNMVAAVPSLHAAYPLLTALFVGRRVPRLIPLLSLYVIAVWVAVVYLGEHYAFDVVMGALYAVGAFGLVQSWPRLKAWRRHFRRPASIAGGEV